MTFANIQTHTSDFTGTTGGTPGTTTPGELKETVSEALPGQ